MNYIFLTDGFEEIEGLTVIDLLRRADIKISSVSITGDKKVRGRSNIKVISDELFSDLNKSQIKKEDFLILPGGTTAFAEHNGLNELLLGHNGIGGNIASICAAPIVLGRLGILNKRNATIFPSMKDELIKAGAVYKSDNVVIDKNIITSRGPATAMDFALAIVKAIKGETVFTEIKEELLFQ
ncbi:MAG: DJ-1/PfpI family protein [Clostridiales Family XIII bacterium]|jgi:4-methyl-5(b-hydroxyethyl)-thiazole monophosphate biosynthesis|nr:DJ-1/PfpI family protein [Clostridiales Family XIII bacterium]